MKIHSRLVGPAALALGLTGAVRGSSETAAGSTACGLITRQEAAAALGAPVPPGTEKSMNVPLQGRVIKMQSCFFGSEVMISRFDLGTTGTALFSAYRQSLAAGSDYQNVTRLGDEAFAAKGQLAIRKGTTGLIVDVGQARGGGAKELKAEQALAALALSRI